MTEITHECRVPRSPDASPRWLPCRVLRRFDPRQFAHSVLVELPDWVELANGQLQRRMHDEQVCFWTWLSESDIRVIDQEAA